MWRGGACGLHMVIAGGAMLEVSLRRSLQLFRIFSSRDNIYTNYKGNDIFHPLDNP